MAAFPASVAANVTAPEKVAVGVPENKQLAPFRALTLGITPAGAGAAVFVHIVRGGLVACVCGVIPPVVITI